MSKRKVNRTYWDTAAGTAIDPRVEKAMKPFLLQNFGNPSSIHREGVLAARAVDEARAKIADILFAHPDEIVFTSGGTEADNLAIIGLAETQEKLRGHIITTTIEHKAVLEPCAYLKKRGFRTTLVEVDKNGVVDLKKLKEALNHDTFLVSVMYANNEIGTVQPIKEIAKIIRKFRKDNKTALPYFHIDACQAPRFLELNVERLGVDLMSLNGSKIYGPKGVGCLFVRRGVPLWPVALGGGQEKGLRSGTHNVPGIVGLAEALAICDKEREKESVKLTKLRDKLVAGLKKEISGLLINGGMENRLPNNVNFSINGLEGEQLVIELDAKGFAVSSGSACSFGEDEGSYVIRAIGGGEDRARGEVRVTLGRDATIDEVKRFVREMGGIREKLLAMVFS